MTADLSALSDLHARAFAPERGWSVHEFQQFQTSPQCHILRRPQALAVVQVVAQEAELLTLAVDPETQGRGLGRALLNDTLAWAHKAGVTAMFLEVAADNRAALALYQSCGFARIGHRRAYYIRATGERVDAFTFKRALS